MAVSQAVRIPRKKKREYREGVRVYLQSEAPRIGSGWRIVQPDRIGHKWVTFHEVSTGRTARVGLTTWKQLTR